MTPAPLITAHGVAKTYGKLRAVTDMELSVAPGEIVGLLGANGAGKTTLIRMILGLEAPDCAVPPSPRRVVRRAGQGGGHGAGTITVLGAEPGRYDRHALGYVPQGLGLYNELSVQQNVDFVAEVFGVAAAGELPAALAEVRTRQVRTIGLGRQRQLAFHCALLHAPRLLVLDEPTSGVDPLARARLWDTIHAQADAGVAVLVTTHYMQEAEQCTRLEIMSRGHRVAHGTTAAITAGARAVVVRAAAWQEAFAALGAAGLPVVLAGRSTRVAGTPVEVVETVLARVGVAAQLSEAPATLEETMVLVEREA